MSSPMTARRAAAFAVALAALAGCSEEKTAWVKPGASNDEFSQSVTICTERARILIHESDSGQITRIDQDEYGRCLTEFGFSRERRGD